MNYMVSNYKSIDIQSSVYAAICAYCICNDFSIPSPERIEQFGVKFIKQLFKFKLSKSFNTNEDIFHMIKQKKNNEGQDVRKKSERKRRTSKRSREDEDGIDIEKIVKKKKPNEKPSILDFFTKK